MAVVDLTQTALAALRRGQDYFRIKQAHADSDWYNIDVSVAGIAIGPDSDIDVIDVTYVDFDDSTLRKTIRVGYASPWTTRLDARMDQTLPSPNNTTPGRMLAGFPTLRRVDSVYFTPNIDLIFYFKEPSTYARVRSPKIVSSSLFTSAGVGTAEQEVFSIPYYGRKKCTLTLYNTDGAKTWTGWRLTGLRFGATTDIEHQISPASGGAANTLAALATASYVLTDARFDGLKLYGTPSAVSTPLQYSYEVSDE